MFLQEATLGAFLLVTASSPPNSLEGSVMSPALPLTALVQQGAMICPRSHSFEMAGPGSFSSSG